MTWQEKPTGTASMYGLIRSRHGDHWGTFAFAAVMQAFASGCTASSSSGSNGPAASCPAPIDVVKETACAPEGLQCPSTDEVITCDAGRASDGSCACVRGFWTCRLPTCGATPTRCAQDSDCAQGTKCFFRVADACAAVGECLPWDALPHPGCRSPTWCACDGTSVVVCAPGGYGPKPIAYEEVCRDAAAEAGTD
jgi:hypothetical protein